jgi:hypothetical protein
MHFTPNLSWSGAPQLVRPQFSLSRRFQNDLFIKKWQLRQCGVLASCPCSTQQDFILFHILRVLGTSELREKLSSNLQVNESDTMQSPIFLELPKVSTDSFRTLFRMLVGLEDFARSNAHYTRRKCHPSLQTSIYERGCLYCCLHNDRHYIDSERHSIFDCPLNFDARREFLLLTKLDFFFERPSSVETLALLIAHVRESGTLVNALARYVLQIQTNRRNLFRRLSTEANKRALSAKLNAAQVCDEN